MASFSSSAASPSTYRIRNAQESNPNDDNYSNSDNNSINLSSTPIVFKKPNKTNEAFKNEKGNKSTFTFKTPNSYVVSAGLFSYKLLDINYSTPRKVIFFCTMLGCKTSFSYKAIRAQIASNGVNHYKDKHKIIATNKDKERTKIKSKLYI